MIKFEEAYQLVINAANQLLTEYVPLIDSLGSVLAENVVSDMNMPPFNKSAMDGYACRIQDLVNELEIIELIPAGKAPEKKIGQNQCSKIMTGAMIPEGADCVILIEHTKKSSANKVIYTKEIQDLNVCQPDFKEKIQPNICYLGEDIKEGEVVLEKGTIIKPQDIAAMATVGHTIVMVSKQPKIAVIPTGNEIVEPEIKPSPTEIRNSNGIQLISQLKKMGITANYFGIARDTKLETLKLIEKAYMENDVILMTGGASKGDFDLVPAILQELGYELLFQEIAVQPGKPSVFGKKGNKFCFALPGNPVATLVQFEILVKPFLYCLMGAVYHPFNIKLPIANNYRRKKADRMSFLPVIINNEGEAELIEYHGSAHINSYSKAWGIMTIPLGISEIKKGEMVNVRQI